MVILTKFHMDSPKIMDVTPFSVLETASIFMIQTLVYFRLKCFFVVSLSCGESSSENVTYLSQSSVTSLTSPCTYTICPCSSQICRIRQASLSACSSYDGSNPFEILETVTKKMIQAFWSVTALTVIFRKI